MATSTKAKTSAKRRVRRRTRRVPRKELLVRTSERSTFKTCRHQWQLAYVDRLKPNIEAPQLRFGSLVHKALELYYKPGIKRGPKPAATFWKAYEHQLAEAQGKFGFTDPEGEWYDAGQLGVDMMEHYVETYGRDEEWEVISSEQTFRVPVYRGGIYLFTYVGTMDGVWRNRATERIIIPDHKTTTHDPIETARNPGYTGPLDQQASGYWTFGVDWLVEQGIMKPRHVEALDGMMYNYLRKGMRDERPTNSDGHALNQDGTVSKRQPAPYFHREMVFRSETERQRTRDRVIHEVVDMIKLRLPESAPQRYKAPHWLNCKLCAYRDICELHEMGADWEAIRDATMTEWDPYDAHYIAEEGK